MASPTLHPKPVAIEAPDHPEDEVLAALDRIARGTFGLCVECARPIERARIDHDPLTPCCAGCAARARAVA